MPPPVGPDILPPEKEQAIAALLREPTVAKAAQAVGVDESTVYRWLKEPVFSLYYREARREGFRHAISITQRYAPAAVQILLKIAGDNDAPHSARVTAAMGLLKFSRESIELDDVVARVEALEQAASPDALPTHTRPSPPSARDEAA